MSREEYASLMSGNRVPSSGKFCRGADVPGKVDVVGDDHDVADLECRVHATCGIAYEEVLMPSAFITRTGKVTCFMSYPS